MDNGKRGDITIDGNERHLPLLAPPHRVRSHALRQGDNPLPYNESGICLFVAVGR